MGEQQIEVMNKYMVGLHSTGIVIMNPPRKGMSDEETLMLAAVLVSMTMKSKEEFDKIYEAVVNT